MYVAPSVRMGAWSMAHVLWQLIEYYYYYYPLDLGGVVWRVKCSDRKLVCAVGSRNGIEDTKLLVLDFDVM